jgi:hypothetical protein
MGLAAFWRAAPAFGAEDPLAVTGSGQWHHRELTAEAARAAGWSADAAAELAFHAHAVDSYLSNPFWCVAGGVARVRGALAGRRHLKALHFDDLTSTDQIGHMWRRYTRGAAAGLLWAGLAFAGRADDSGGPRVGTWSGLLPRAARAVAALH